MSLASAVRLSPLVKLMGTAVLEPTWIEKLPADENPVLSETDAVSHGDEDVA
jgi:hypothetical protein